MTDTNSSNVRVKPQTPDLPQTHPGHDAAWASYWQEKSRWQDQEIEQLRADMWHVVSCEETYCARCDGILTACGPSDSQPQQRSITCPHHPYQEMGAYRDCTCGLIQRAESETHSVIQCDLAAEHVDRANEGAKYCYWCGAAVATLNGDSSQNVMTEKPGHFCGKLKADCQDEYCPDHGRDIR